MEQYEQAERQRDPVAYRARKNAERHRAKERDPARHRRHVRRRNLRKYGLTPEEYDALLIGQSGRCAICADPLWPDRRTHVDHCHRTSRVRALLCHGCNVGLGAFRDDPDRLLAAVQYLAA